MSGFDTDRNFVEASASQQVQQVLHYIIARANTKALRQMSAVKPLFKLFLSQVDHLPSPEKDTVSYKFEVAFLSGEGKESCGMKLAANHGLSLTLCCQEIGTGSLLPQGLWCAIDDDSMTCIALIFRLGILAQPDNSSFTALASSFVQSPDKHVHHLR